MDTKISNLGRTKDKIKQFPWDWTQSKGNEAWKIVRYSEKPLDIRMYDLDHIFGKGFNIELLRLSYALEFYSSSNIQGCLYTWYDILKRTFLEGPGFASHLSDVRKYSMIITHNDTIPDFIEEGCCLKENIEEIYDPQCLIRWNIIPEGEWKYALDSNPEVDHYSLMGLKHKLRELIPDGVDTTLDILDELSFLKNSNVFIDPSDEKTKGINRDLHTTGKYSGRYTDYIEGVLTPTWKNPEELREAVTLGLDSLHTLSDGAKKMSLIFKNIKGYSVHNAMKKRNGLYNMKDKKYLMLDFKKCGWTTDHKLILIGLEVLIEKYPHEDVFKHLYKCYTNKPLLWVNNERHVLQRGTLLGMLVELVTVLSLATFECAKEDGVLPEHMQGWFNNDDTLLFINCRNPAVEDINVKRIIEYYNSYGWVVHEKKTFLSDVGEWAKTWTSSSFLQENRTRQFLAMLLGLDAYNISHAKELFSSNYGKFWGLTAEDYQKALSCLITFWGFEFSRMELNLPVEYGGWVRIIEEGLNTALLEYWDIPARFRRVFLTKKPDLVPKFRKKRKGLENPFFQKLKNLCERNDSTIFNWEDFVTQVEEFSEKTIFWHSKYKFHGKLNRIFEKNYWSLYAKRRKESYDIKTYVFGDYYQKFHETLDREKWNNYAPPPDVIGKREFNTIVPYFTIPECSDLRRYCLRQIHGVQVREVNALPGCLLQLLNLRQPTKELERDPYSWSKFYDQAWKLSKFGDALNVHNYLISKYGIDYDLLTNEPSVVEQIKKFAFGNGTDLLVLDGYLIKINLNEIDLYDRLGYIENIPSVYKSIDPDLTWEIWIETVKELNSKFLPEKEVVYLETSDTKNSPDLRDWTDADDMEYYALLEEQRINDNQREYYTQMVKGVVKRSILLGDYEERLEYFEKIAEEYAEPVTLDGGGYGSDFEGAGGLFGGDSDSD
jgi:hypothetical protein